MAGNVEFAAILYLMSEFALPCSICSLRPFSYVLADISKGPNVALKVQE